MKKFKYVLLLHKLHLMTYLNGRKKWHSNTLYYYVTRRFYQIRSTLNCTFYFLATARVHYFSWWLPIVMTNYCTGNKLRSTILTVSGFEIADTSCFECKFSMRIWGRFGKFSAWHEDDAITRSWRFLFVLKSNLRLFFDNLKRAVSLWKIRWNDTNTVTICWKDEWSAVKGGFKRWMHAVPL